MKLFIPLFKREFFSYFRSPVAYVFIVVFLLASVGSSFFLGRFFDSNQADLSSFFSFLPWLYLVFVPAVGMRLWAEERRSGTLELLFTMPVTLKEAVLAKFFAGWAFLGVALLLTFPMIFTVNYLGHPDNGVIFAGYIGTWFLAGGYLAISCLSSAMTRNQVIAFIMAVVVCFVLVLTGWGVFTDMLANFCTAAVIDFIAGTGFISHYQQITKGIIDSRDIFYFASIIGVALAANAVVLEARRGN